MRLVTQRLIIRPWTTQKRDADAFYFLNSDEKVMEFYPFRRNRTQSDEMLEKIINIANENNYGWSAVCLQESGEPIGFAGLSVVNFDAHFTPATEIGWRILPAHMGKGFATEAAKALLKFGFVDHDLNEIVSFALARNPASTNVMKKIGMCAEPDNDFDMPGVESADHRRHVFYRLTKQMWKSSNSLV